VTIYRWCNVPFSSEDKAQIKKIILVKKYSFQRILAKFLRTNCNRGRLVILLTVICDKILCPWVRRVPTNERAKKNHSLRYFTAIGSFSMKIVADRLGTDMLRRPIISTADELVRNVNINDLEPPKITNFSKFVAILGCEGTRGIWQAKQTNTLSAHYS